MSQATPPSTQQFLDIYDVTSNFLILKDGGAAIILTVDAMNFGLLAEEEQDGVMYAYAGLLNSLNYPIQVVVQSKTKDVTAYLRLLMEQEETTNSEIMRKRIREYRQFVGNLIQERNVLDKRFYVVVPASGLEMGFLSPQTFVPGKQNFDVSTVERSVVLEKAVNILEPRRDHLIAQFARIGLYSRQLSTQEIIQLFYVNYNPEALEGQEIADSQSYTSPLVRAQVGEFATNLPTPPNAHLPHTNPVVSLSNDTIINPVENFANISGQDAPILDSTVSTIEPTTPPILINQPPTTGTQPPTTTDQPTNPQQMIANDPLPVVSNQQSTISNQLPVTNNLQPTTDYRPPAISN